MFSGKSAVFDFFSEFSEIDSGNYQEEFDLFRVPGGLFDLVNAFDNWTYMGVDGAIRRFQSISKKMIRTPRGFERLYKIGWEYERRCPGIALATEEFIENISTISWEADWPYAELDMGPWSLLRRKVFNRLGKSSPKYELQLGGRDLFFAHVEKYIQKIFINADGADNSFRKYKVIINALDPTNPVAGLRLSPLLHSVVVDRDVRDIYANAVTFSSGFNDNVEYYRRIAGADNIENFIARQKLIRQSLPYNDSFETKSVKVQFEDLVLNYNDERQSLIDVFQLNGDSQVKFSKFNPEVSNKNVGIWRGLDREHFEAIAAIENELENYCYIKS